jgi:hypothetical protein
VLFDDPENAVNLEHHKKNCDDLHNQDGASVVVDVLTLRLERDLYCLVDLKQVGNIECSGEQNHGIPYINGTKEVDIEGHEIFGSILIVNHPLS